MSKQVTMSLDEYNEEMQKVGQQAGNDGYAQGMSFIMQIALDVVENESKRIELDVTGHPKVIEFVHRLQDAVGQEHTEVKDHMNQQTEEGESTDGETQED